MKSTARIYKIAVLDKSGQNQKPGVGATYKDGTLQVKGLLLSADLTYVKRTDTILTPGFFGQVEYKRQK
jgi:hypothetical protein